MRELPGTQRTNDLVAAAAEAVATLAMALWLGGLLALGALAAPTVFGELERDSAGTVMGTIFGKFDRMVLVLVVVFAVAETVRTYMDRDRLGSALARIRLSLAVLLVALALISSLWLTPGINEMFAEGVRRGVGEAGQRMDRMHAWSETLGKLAAASAAAWIAIGNFTGRRRGRLVEANESGAA
jgi:uncharacterized membrane protein